MNNTNSEIAYESWLKWASFFLLSAKGIAYLLYPENFLDSSFLNTTYLGVPLLLAACLLHAPNWSLKQFTAYLSFTILFLDNCNSFYLSSFLPHQFIEHTLMMFTPLLYLVVLKQGLEKNLRKLMLAVSLTFVGHGAFAVSWNHIPSHFSAMTQFILGLEGVYIKSFLLTMGILDFLAAIFIFTQKAKGPALMYMVVWGVLTSLARFVYGFEADLIKGVLGTLYRFPHFIVPLVLYTDYYFKRRSHSSSLL
ncbi:hypothetical protein SAMN05216474_0682 [Lishizhenia tianjinensis]|uniref:Uncharacterized protein n=1 Tax=Lishizhenia tianjinensis TaxID=477690 RepID=A0A1I6Y6I1_9FLAO|nr:hypothetical protein [Lishizhenia tianjinensis]SFT45967.1 hypothetical protein SAMN05216474_0682 [Lishizhenia tianjinensis]